MPCVSILSIACEIMKNMISVIGFALLAGWLMFGPDLSKDAFGWVFSGLGLLALLSGISMTQKGKASLNWPKTKGLIRISRVMKSRSGGRSGGMSYNFEVEYEFVVDRKIYTGSNYSYRMNYNAANPSGARDLVDRYPIDSEVEVFYDPKKPTRNVLLPGISIWSYSPCFIGVVFICIGFAITTGTMS